jgi:hypothetical protein
VTAPDLSGVEQLPQPDPRGLLAMRYLPAELQNAEDTIAAFDASRGRVRFARPATATERILLGHLGYKLPEQLTTEVHVSGGIRSRTWPQLEGQTTR